MKTKSIFFIMIVAALFTACNNDDFETGKVDNLPNITGYPIVGTN